MKAINSKRFGLFCLLMFLVAEGEAQKTYPYVTNGNTIVSRDAAGGVKEEALLTPLQKTWLLTTNSPTVTYNEGSDENRVSAKFQVAYTDASTYTKWAYTFCKSYSTGAVAGSWRLPTQRELMLMWIFQSKLTGCGNITSASGDFWSSTEVRGYTSHAWYVVFSNGYTGPNYKSNSKYVRCVRDL